MGLARVFGFVLLTALALAVVSEFLGVVDLGVLDLIGVERGGGGGEEIFGVNTDIPEGAVTRYTPPEVVEWFRSKYNPWDYPATAIWGLPHRETGRVFGIGSIPFNRTWVEGELNASMSIEEVVIDGFRYTVIDIGSGEIDGISLLQYYLYLQHVISQMEGREWDIFFTIDSAPRGIELMLWSRNQSIALAYLNAGLEERARLCNNMGRGGFYPPVFCDPISGRAQSLGADLLTYLRVNSLPLTGRDAMCYTMLRNLRMIDYPPSRIDTPEAFKRYYSMCSWAVDLLTHKERSVALAYWLTLKIRGIGIHLAELTCNPQTNNLKIKVIAPQTQTPEQLKQAITKYIEHTSNQKPVIIKYGDVNEMAVAEYQLDRGVIECRATKPAIAYTANEVAIVPETLLDRYTVIHIVDPLYNEVFDLDRYYRYFLLRAIRDVPRDIISTGVAEEIAYNKTMNILRPLVYRGETLAGDIFNIPGDPILGMRLGVLLIEVDDTWTRGWGAVDRLYVEFLSDLAFRIASTGRTLVGYVKIAYDPERNVAEIVEERTYSVPVERLVGRD